jgi:hypothetical protein
MISAGPQPTQVQRDEEKEKKIIQREMRPATLPIVLAMGIIADRK